jgi:L-Ala-D/L-Glu epimerase
VSLDLVVRERVLAFRQPIDTAFGRLIDRTVLEVDLLEDGEVVGRGEASPLAPYDGVTLQAVADALQTYRDLLRSARTDTGAALLDACAAANPLPQALAAVDIALWDRGGRREGCSIAALLSQAPAADVDVNATVAARTPEAVASACASAADRGYHCVKLKVGFDDDLERVRAARDALGDHVALRLDANGAWSVDEAIDRINALSIYALELVEEPVHGLAELAAVREGVAVRVAMDESTALPGAVASQSADAICLKIGRCGGISGLLAAATLVRANGGEAYVASVFDGPRGVAAAIRACAALGPMPPCGLATIELFDIDPEPLAAHAGAIGVPAGTGLGTLVQ